MIRTYKVFFLVYGRGPFGMRHDIHEPYYPGIYKPKTI